MVKIVIMGLGAAGFGAALAVKKQDRTADITIIDNKDFDLLHQCGLPFVLEGEIEGFYKLKHSLNLDKMGIKLVKGDVSKVDFENKKVVCGEEISYDKLIIAVGAKPFVPSIKTDNKVYTVHSIKDTQELSKHVKKGENAIIIGAGAIGLETAIALKKKGMNVKVIDMLKSTFPRAIDKDISSILEEKLKEKGIELELGSEVKDIKEKAIIVMATGVMPNVSFLEGSAVKITKFGVEVDERMETSVKDVYAVGDCVSVKSLINDERWPSMLANNAYREGLIAGCNAAGGDKRFNGILGTFVSVIGDIEVAATGFNSFFAEKYGIKTIVSKAKGKNRPEWYGDSKELTVKLIADSNGKLIGGQAIGTGAKERINIMSTAIKAGFGFKDISELELAYCPAVSEYYDVLVMAAELGLRKLK